MTRKVSILVAIYNVGKEFLIPCIESLINQTYTNIEIILVNDGSTDGSGEIVDSYEDPRIIKIHTPNQGVTAARKTGWMNATGDYCLFVDGDDMLAPDAVEFFMEKVKVKEYDIITGWFKKVYPDGQSFEMPFRFPTGEMTSYEYVKHSLSISSPLWALSRSIFKRLVITEETWDIDRFFIRGEDGLALLGILNNASTVLCTGHIFYHYVHRASSSTNSILISIDYRRELHKQYLTIVGEKLKPFIYPNVLQKLSFIYLKKAYGDDPEKKKKEYEFLLKLKDECKGRLTLRLRLEFLIMKSSVLSYMYRTFGWRIFSTIKHRILRGGF